MLKALLEQHRSHKGQCRCHPILKSQSELKIDDALRLQLEAFWLGEPPFHAPVMKGDIMEWWTNLGRENSPRSNVIAVTCFFQIRIRKLMFFADAWNQNIRDPCQLDA